MQIRILLTVTLFVGVGMLSNNAFAQAVEKIYAANSCDTGTDEIGGLAADNSGMFHSSSLEFGNAGDQSITKRAGFDDGVVFTCPITRQKINSSRGAKFSVFVEKNSSGDNVNCQISSRRPHNGALVSSGVRATAPGSPAGQYRLVRSIAPSSTFGHYSLECQLDGFPDLHSYIIREF